MSLKKYSINMIFNLFLIPEEELQPTSQRTGTAAEEELHTVQNVASQNEVTKRDSVHEIQTLHIFSYLY